MVHLRLAWAKKDRNAKTIHGRVAKVFHPGFTLDVEGLPLLLSRFFVQHQTGFLRTRSATWISLARAGNRMKKMQPSASWKDFHGGDMVEWAKGRLDLLRPCPWGDFFFSLRLPCALVAYSRIPPLWCWMLLDG